MKTITLLLIVFVVLMLAACQSSGQELPTLVPTAAQEATPTLVAEEPTATSEPTLEPTEIPTEVPTEVPTEIPTEEPTASAPAMAFCPEVPRPALVLFVPGEKYMLADPASGASCDLPIPVPMFGALQVAGEHIYYQAADGNNMVVQRLSPDGMVEPLPYTALDMTNGLYQIFLVSPDDERIAWGYAGAKQDEPEATISELWIAEMETGQVTAHLEESKPMNEGMHALTPVRFSDDGSTLFYARQPIGIGGSWMSFVGRYNSLSSVPSAGGEGSRYFDCADEGLFLCIGDFYLVNGQLANLVYTDDQAGAVVVLTGDGGAINNLPTEVNYIGYPTFSPTAELVYYTAELTEDSILPVAASLHRVAPPTAPSEVVVSDPALLLPNQFIDGSRLVVGYAPDESTFGNAVVDLMDGSVTPLSQWPTASVVAVMP